MHVMTRCALLALALATLDPAVAAAGAGQCHVVDISFMTADDSGNTRAPYHFRPQMVVWLEDSAGNYVDTLYITAQTGSFGIGNRPGRFDFNSGPIWPYGRRITTFPVWAHKDKPDLDNHGQFPSLEYQDKNDSNLSHAVNRSSTEQHFCRPLDTHEMAWHDAYDVGTCATTAFTDKGAFSATLPTTGYPPRVDVIHSAADSLDVELYPMMNPFDAVSQATPQEGVPSDITWPIPSLLPPGDYVVVVEVSKEFDYNQVYNDTKYPALTDMQISYSMYGAPYRGQPSVIYKVPFTIGTTESLGATDTYVGYGDPDGLDGNIRAPDSTITTDRPGSGAARLALTADASGMYRVKVDSRPEFDNLPPGIADEARAIKITASAATVSFVAPGDDGSVGKVRGYEIRYMADTELTEANFASGAPLKSVVVPDDPGQIQTFDLDGLLPETTYYVGIRAFDDCHNTGTLAVAKLTTPANPVGQVDACFIATAAYGSVMATDVGMLRHFRDAILRDNVFGEMFVETYYTFGPAVAGIVDPSDVLRTTARTWLEPVVRFAGSVKR